MMRLWRLIPGLLVALVLVVGAPHTACAQSSTQRDVESFTEWVMTLKPVNEQLYAMIDPMSAAEETYYGYIAGILTEEEARAEFVEHGMAVRRAAQETLEMWRALPEPPGLNNAPSARMRESVNEIPNLIVSMEDVALSSIDAFATMALDPDADLDQIPVLVFRRTEAMVTFLERSLRNDLAALPFGHPQGVVLESAILSNAIFLDLERDGLSAQLGLTAEESAALIDRVDSQLDAYDALVDTGPGLQSALIRSLEVERTRSLPSEHELFSRVIGTMNMYDVAWEIERDSIAAYRAIAKARRSDISVYEYNLVYDRMMTRIEANDQRREEEIFARVERLQGN